MLYKNQKVFEQNVASVRSIIHKQGYIPEADISSELSGTFSRENGYERYFLPESGQPRMVAVIATSNALFGDVLRDFYKNREGGEEAQPSSPTPVQKLVNETLEQVQETRERIINELMQNPGYLSTFGDDFVVEFGDIRTFHKEADFNRLDEFKMLVEHPITIRQNTSHEKDLKGHALRQDLEGNLESV